MLFFELSILLVSLVNHVQLKLLVRVHHTINLNEYFKGEKRVRFAQRRVSCELSSVEIRYLLF